MNGTKDAMVVLRRAMESGDPMIVDRIIVKSLPQLQAHGISLNSAELVQMDRLDLPAALVDRLQVAALELMAADHPEISCNV